MFLHVAPCFLIHFSVNWLSLKGVGECVPVSLKGAKETEPDKFRRSACNRAPVSWKEVKEAETSAPDVKPTGSPNYRTLDYQRYVVVLNWTQKIWPDAIRLEFWIAFEIAWSWLHIAHCILKWMQSSTDDASCSRNIIFVCYRVREETYNVWYRDLLLFTE